MALVYFLAILGALVVMKYVLLEISSIVQAMGFRDFYVGLQLKNKRKGQVDEDDDPPPRLGQ